MKVFLRSVALMIVVVSVLTPCVAATPVQGIQKAVVPARRIVASAQENVDVDWPYANDAVGRSASTYFIGEDRYNFVTVFTRSRNQGYRGPITIQIVNFDSSNYVCDVMVYGKDGMLGGGDDQLGNTNLLVVNPDGAWAVTSVVMRIRPRPRLLFEAKPKGFQVNVTY